MLFKSCIAFAFTASMDSNLVPLSADLIFGKRRSCTVLGLESTEMFHQWNVVFRQIPLHRQRVVVMKNP